MIHEAERRILRFFGQVEGDERLQRRVRLILVGREAWLEALPRGEAQLGDLPRLPCQQDDVLELVELGYLSRVDGPRPNLYRLSQEGRALVTRGFVVPPPTSPGGQHITITNSSIGNLAASVRGSASVAEQTPPGGLPKPEPSVSLAPSLLTAPTPLVGRIAYVGLDKELRTLDVVGGGDLPLPTAGRPYSPRWSPDGRKIVYGEELSPSPRKTQIAVLDPATGLSHILVGPEVRFGDALHPPIQYWNYYSMCWTPAGDAVVYKKDSGARFGHAYMRVPAQGGEPEELPGSDYGFFSSASDFDISPTDGRMAITENGLDHNMGSGRLAVAYLDGCNVRIVRPFGGAYYAAPTWTADGREIAVVQGVGGEPVIWKLTLINPETGAQRVLGPVSRGSSYAFAPDGKWMVLADSATRQLLLINLADFAERRAIGHGFLPAWGSGGNGD